MIMEVLQNEIEVYPDSRLKLEGKPIQADTTYDTIKNRIIDEKARRIGLLKALKTQYKTMERHNDIWFVTDGYIDMADEDNMYHPLNKIIIGEIEYHTQFSNPTTWTYGFGEYARIRGVIKDGEYALLFIRSPDYQPKAVSKWHGQTAKLAQARLLGENDEQLFNPGFSNRQILQFIDPETGEVIFSNARQLGLLYFYEVIIAAKDKPLIKANIIEAE